MFGRSKGRKTLGRRLRQRGGLFARTGVKRRLLSMGVLARRKAKRLGGSALRIARKHPRVAAGLGVVTVGALGLAVSKLGGRRR